MRNKEIEKYMWYGLRQPRSEYKGVGRTSSGHLRRECSVTEGLKETDFRNRPVTSYKVVLQGPSTMGDLIGYFPSLLKE